VHYVTDTTRRYIVYSYIYIIYIILNFNDIDVLCTVFICSCVGIRWLIQITTDNQLMYNTCKCRYMIVCSFVLYTIINNNIIIIRTRQRRVVGKKNRKTIIPMYTILWRSAKDDDCRRRGSDGRGCTRVLRILLATYIRRNLVNFFKPKLSDAYNCCKYMSNNVTLRYGNPFAYLINSVCCL